MSTNLFFKYITFKHNTSFNEPDKRSPDAVFPLPQKVTFFEKDQ